MTDTKEKSPDGTEVTDSVLPNPGRRDALKSVAAGIEVRYPRADNGDGDQSNVVQVAA